METSGTADLPPQQSGADQGAGPRARLIICDDHRVVAAGLAKLLDPPHRVVAVAHAGNQLLAILRDTPAECLLLDLLLPDRMGLALLPHIRQIQPALKIVVVTMLVDRSLADACLRDGADGFVPKDAGPAELLDAIAEVMAGRRFLSSRVPKTSHCVGSAARRLGFERLTPRQQEIMLLLGDGKRPAHIAAALGLERSTVTFHLHNLMRRLGIPSEDALVRVAVLMAEEQAIANT
jgi:DNA-binding NarL/FixJ family response regulator